MANFAVDDIRRMYEGRQDEGVDHLQRKWPSFTSWKDDATGHSGRCFGLVTFLILLRHINSLTDEITANDDGNSRIVSLSWLDSGPTPSPAVCSLLAKIMMEDFGQEQTVGKDLPLLQILKSPYMRHLWSRPCLEFFSRVYLEMNPQGSLTVANRLKGPEPGKVVVIRYNGTESLESMINRDFEMQEDVILLSNFPTFFMVYYKAETAQGPHPRQLQELWDLTMRPKTVVYDAAYPSGRLCEREEPYRLVATIFARDPNTAGSHEQIRTYSLDRRLIVPDMTWGSSQQLFCQPNTRQVGDSVTPCFLIYLRESAKRPQPQVQAPAASRPLYCEHYFEPRPPSNVLVHRGIGPPDAPCSAASVARIPSWVYPVSDQLQSLHFSPEETINFFLPGVDMDEVRRGDEDMKPTAASRVIKLEQQGKHGYPQGYNHDYRAGTGIGGLGLHSIGDGGDRDRRDPEGLPTPFHSQPGGYFGSQSSGPRFPPQFPGHPPPTDPWPEARTPGFQSSQRDLPPRKDPRPEPPNLVSQRPNRPPPLLIMQGLNVMIAVIGGGITITLGTHPTKSIVTRVLVPVCGDVTISQGGMRHARANGTDGTDGTNGTTETTGTTWTPGTTGTNAHVDHVVEMVKGINEVLGSDYRAHPPSNGRCWRRPPREDWLVR
ncbi:hypothetical protein F4778DRAFT_781228 [Xylariomycetidae sp. FL2044]|nr:hypothetical protein F4778DRAFT_781228 [Xylariomycetidae sp. FL2044]